MGEGIKAISLPVVDEDWANAVEGRADECRKKGFFLLPSELAGEIGIDADGDVISVWTLEMLRGKYDGK